MLQYQADRLFEDRILLSSIHSMIRFHRRKNAQKAIANIAQINAWQ